MEAKPYTVLTVRMPNDLQNVLESISAERGECVSTIVRALVRQAAADAQRVDHGLVAGSPVSARNYK
jgi:hypothetical protein